MKKIIFKFKLEENNEKKNNGNRLRKKERTVNALALEANEGVTNGKRYGEKKRKRNIIIISKNIQKRFIIYT